MLRKVTQILVFSACFLVTVEVICRIDQWWQFGAPLFGSYTYDSALFVRDEYGIRGKPNGLYEKWRLNSLGFRGPEFDAQKDPHRLRVVCLGASETFGLYESPHKEWPMQLGQLLEKSGLDAEVINAAVPGMGMRQRLIHLEKRLLQLQPDVILFVLEYGGYAGLTPLKVRENPSAIVLPSDRQGVIEVMKSIRSAARIKDVVLAKLPELLQAFFTKTERAIKLRMVRQEMGDRFGMYREVTAFEVEQFVENLEEVRMVADRAGSRLILLPPAMWLNDDMVSMMSLSWPYLNSSWWWEARSKFAAAGVEFARRNGVEYLDLANVVHGREQDWMKDMLHFSDEGANRVASQIEQQMMVGRGLRKDASAM